MARSKDPAEAIRLKIQGGVMGRLRTATAVAVLALAAAACSNNTTTTPRSGGTTPAGGGSIVNKGTADATAVTDKQEIEMDNEGSTEFYFKPTFVKVKPGQILTIELKNEGTVPHNFSITSLSINKTIEAGKEGEVNLTFPAAGGADVQFFCSFHSGSGMKGTFFFGSAPSASGGTTGGGTTNTTY
jgi:plastocyanin